jgi:hypothetical protein
LNANKAAIRTAYQVAEDKEIDGWVNCFTGDGTFTDESIGVTYRGPSELGRTVEIYATAFPDMKQLRAGLTQAGLPVEVINIVISIQTSFAAGAFDIVTR